MKILNFGSLNIDYVYSVDHFVQAGETLASRRLETFPGGKGLNQSVALAKAGADVYHAGMIGIDGEMLKEVLKGHGVKVEYVKTCNGKTGHAVIQVDKEGGNNILLYGGTNKMITRDFIDEVLKKFSEEDVILLQNEINNVDYIINEAYKKGMKIVFNPSPIDEEITQLSLDKVSCFLLNEIEGMYLTGSSDKEEIVTHLLQKYPNAQIILTLGREGVVYQDASMRCEQPIYKVKAVDTTAAGDTFTGYFVACTVKGLSIKESLDQAAKAAAIAVSRKGASTSIPSAEEVEKENIKIS